ncbi:uncharacterized protein LOC133188236 [Saccostrea echinata]|uniref:uncharacterized protein LOC133188236 n=1 Tax=Saccostrea echinata TaxID=191078 RepID=UPI002A80AF29|nr:uncharacterized protein LOC133188236 [Saccostrea echinata]
MRRGLVRYLKKLSEEEIPQIDQKIDDISKQITENENICDFQIESLGEHCKEIISKIEEAKQHHEQALRDNLTKKNTQMKQLQSKLERNKEQILETVEYITKNNNLMSNYSLIDNHRELARFLRNISTFDIENCEHSLKYRKGEVRQDFLDNMIGKTFDLDNIVLAETHSFKYGDKRIIALKAFSQDHCYIAEIHSDFIGQVNKNGDRENKFSISPNDLCVTDTGDVYITNYKDGTITLLSQSRVVSKVVSTDPLIPVGICQSVDGGLLVTFRDSKPDIFKVESDSRRLVRHVTLTGDVINEFEYQGDKMTRLFTLPWRITQNGNTQIYVVNRTSLTSGDLVILSSSGRLISVYPGRRLKENFTPCDVVCDSYFNVLVSDLYNHRVHLLSPDGEFLKFLLTEKEVNEPFSLSLFNSSFWVGENKGIVKVFQCQI